ncbi:biofilm formation protein PslA [Kordiimonas sediminis]|uniref:Biofilm formation protein PslA n=1 Tax=Kordiimonas sediminis TaxID=1735581 RepID=A0A919E980_9PROT|nr:undecaprenyl-phosphate glucose phosphotransferase [Kordiimonas sediminis]GHF25427.1 biofilm formation protein PslA [Kordiimonas sediminis]
MKTQSEHGEKVRSRKEASNLAFKTLNEQEPQKAISPATIEYMLRAGDLLSIFICGIVTIIFYGERIAQDTVVQYTNIVVIGAILASLSIFTSGGYDTTIFFNVWRSIRSAVTGWVLAIILLLLVGYAFKTTGEFSRAWGMSWFVITTLLLITCRIAVSFIALSLRHKGKFNSKAVIIGADSQGQRLQQFIKQTKWLTIDILAFFDDRADRAPEEINGVPVIVGTEKLIELIRKEKIDQVLIALPWHANERLRSIIELISETPVKIRLAPDLAMYDYVNHSFTSLGGLPVLDIFDRPISGWNSLTKRLEDIVLGSFFLILAMPILLITAIAIKVDSKGPILFKQAREGYNNKTFYIWKFRSMKVHNCETDNVKQAEKNDSRITKVGAFIRKTSIDELPQLFNVIFGDMSIVGPRPHAPSTKAAGIPFEKAVRRYASRHNVKPGITGWAQVRGWRGETDTIEKLEQRLQHDLYYIDHWSLGMDISIIARTILVVLWQKEAY